VQFHRNPFQFKHVQVLKGGAAIDDCGPCVVMATPSMLQSGLSRDLFEAWCESSQNTVIIADFAVQGTLARDILSSPTHVMSRQGVKVSATELHRMH
jgi:cleavage and polyadenylation specificity factor subunit 3